MIPIVIPIAEITSCCNAAFALAPICILFGTNEIKTARENACQKYVEDTLAEEIIKTKISETDTILVDYSKEKEEILVVVKKSDSTDALPTG